MITIYGRLIAEEQSGVWFAPAELLDRDPPLLPTRWFARPLRVLRRLRYGLDALRFTVGRKPPGSPWG